MSQHNEIERGDTIATKDGKAFRVLSVYKSGNEVTRVEGVNDSDESPKRTPLLPSDIIRILRKAPKPIASEVSL